MAALLVDVQPYQRAGVLDFDEKMGGVVAHTSVESVSTDGDSEEAEWGNERLSSATGDFEVAYKFTKARAQFTDLRDLERLEAAMPGSDTWFFSAPYERALIEVPVTLREVEKAWVASHTKELSKFAGEWLVVEQNQLITHNVDFAQAVREAKSRGVKIPYITRLPLQREKPFIG